MINDLSAIYNFRFECDFEMIKQTNYNNELVIESKFKQQLKEMMTSLKYSQNSDSNPQNSTSRLNDTIFTRELLKRLNKYKDDEQVTLQQSIPILYELNIFQELTSIPDAKRRLTQQSKPNNRLQLEARFIYNLWKLIGNQTIPMSYFKQIVALFITREISQLAQKLQEMFQNEGDLLVDILAIWEGMLESNHNHSRSCSQDFKESSLATEQQANFHQSQPYHIPPANRSISHHERITNPRNHRQYQNQMRQSSNINTSKGSAEGFHSKSRRENLQQATDQMCFNGLYQLPVMTVQKQKELVNRLYVVNKNQRYQQLKKLQDQQRILKQMQQCTFRPNIEKVNKPRPYTSQSKKPSKLIPGFQKAIQRMKIGQQKTKQLKEKLQLRSNNIKQQPKLQQSKVMLPPKFLARQNKKQEKKILFTIQFDIGRRKLTCKVHENESSQQLARNIQSIYSLKQQSYEQIKQIIDQQIERYLVINTSSNDHENYDNDDEDYQQDETEEDENCVY